MADLYNNAKGREIGEKTLSQASFFEKLPPQSIPERRVFDAVAEHMKTNDYAVREYFIEYKNRNFE